MESEKCCCALCPLIVTNCCVFLLQYYHSVRVFAGQDPASVWVGWVTPDYHYHSKNFSLNKTRTVTITLGDERGRVHERQAPCVYSNMRLSWTREETSHIYWFLSANHLFIFNMCHSTILGTVFCLKSQSVNSVLYKTQFKNSYQHSK